MEKTDRLAGETKQKEILERFVGSYAERDQSVNFADWLAGCLRQEMPGLASDESERLSGEII